MWLAVSTASWVGKTAGKTGRLPFFLFPMGDRERRTVWVTLVAGGGGGGFLLLFSPLIFLISVSPPARKWAAGVDGCMIPPLK